MKKILKHSILFIILIGILPACNAQKKEVKLVKMCFDGYKSAILNDKGYDAVKYLDSRTLHYYDEILTTIKEGDTLQIDGLNLIDKIMVFSIRHRASKEDILSFDAKGLVVYAIQEGMVGKSSVVNNSIGKVNIDKDFASGQLVVNGEPTTLDFHFYKEDDFWKIDLTSIFAISEIAIVEIQKESGMEENEFIFYLLETLTGRKPEKEIWERIQ